MADSTVVVAAISAGGAVVVAAAGVCGNLWNNRRTVAEPTSAPATSADLDAVVAGLQAVVREKDEAEARHRAEIDALLRRALACEIALGDLRDSFHPPGSGGEG